MPTSHEGLRNRYKSLTLRDNQARSAEKEEVPCPWVGCSSEGMQRLQGPGGIQAKQP